MANAKFIELWCKKKVKEAQQSVCNNLRVDVEQRARRNFLRASKEIPSADTFIDVFSIEQSNGFKIVCGGTQVLFAEFGAGKSFYHRTPMTTDENNVEIEKAPRPTGIVGIGEYGKHYGKQEKWYFSDTNLIESNGKNHTSLVKATKSGNLIYITEGIRPTRALYNAVSSGIKVFTQGKIIRR